MSWTFLQKWISRPWVLPLALAVLCLVAYANSFQNGFLLDDRLVLFGQKGVEHRAFLDIFRTKHGDYYRPLVQLTLWVFYHLFGKQVVLYHAANLLMVWGCAWLFFLIVDRLSGDRRLAFLTAVLYAIHPVQAFFVNYTGSTGLPLTTIGIQVAFLSFMNAVERRRLWWYFLSLLVMGLTFLTHESAVMLVVAVAAWLFFIRREDVLKSAVRLLPFLVLSAVYFFFRIKLTTSYQFSSGLKSALEHPAGAFATWMDLMGWYFSKLVFPYHMMFMRSTIFGADHLLLKVIVLAVVMAALVYLLAFRWKRGLKSFALSVFILGLLPSLVACFSFYPIVRPFIEPHWFSFSSIGYFILVAGFLLWLFDQRRVLGGVVIAVALAGLLILVWNYNARYRTEEGFCRYWLSLDDGNITPYWGLGRSRLEAGDCSGAVEVFRRAMDKLKTFNVFLLADTGHCYDELGNDQWAFFFLDKAVREDPEYALAYHYAGLYFMKREDYRAAEIVFRKSLSLDPKGSPSGPFLKSIEILSSLTNR